MSERKAIIAVDPGQEVTPATSELVEGRKITAWSPYCGSYGQGGPGFFGLQLDGAGRQGGWLILTLWGAANWLELNDRWVAADPEQFYIQRPLYNNIAGYEQWDQVTPLLVGQKLNTFTVNRRDALLEIGDSTLRLHEDPMKRPFLPGDGSLRVLAEDEDLRDAWILSFFPDVHI